MCLKIQFHKFSPGNEKIHLYVVTLPETVQLKTHSLNVSYVYILLSHCIYQISYFIIRCLDWFRGRGNQNQSEQRYNEFMRENESLPTSQTD